MKSKVEIEKVMNLQVFELKVMRIFESLSGRFDCSKWRLGLEMYDIHNFLLKNYRYPIDPVGGHMLYPGILAMQV